MKKLIFRALCLFLIASIVLPLFQIVSLAQDANGFLAGTPNMETYIKSQISKESNYIANSAKITITSENNMKIGFYSADDLTAYYLKKTKQKIQNTCAEVAIVNILVNLVNNKRAQVYKSYENLFCDIIDYAKQKGYYTTKEGTINDKLDDLYLHVLECFAEAGTYSLCNTKKTMASFINNEAKKKDGVGFPVLFTVKIPNQKLSHTVAVNGYIKYKVTYRKAKKVLFVKTGETTCTKEFLFFSMSDGNRPAASYISENTVKENGVSAMAIWYKK